MSEQVCVCVCTCASVYAIKYIIHALLLVINPCNPSRLFLLVLVEYCSYPCTDKVMQNIITHQELADALITQVLVICFCTYGCDTLLLLL